VTNNGDGVLSVLKAWWDREIGWYRASAMSSAAATFQEHRVQPVDDSARYKIWIDGVGAFLICLGDRVSIGGPRYDANAADIPLLANLSRRHATFVRGKEGYVLEAHGPVKVAGRLVEGAAHLNHDYSVELGGSVRLRFRLPSVLSATAVIDFVSDHRPPQSVDGVVLLEENCLLGPGRDNHIRCPEWGESVLLYRKEGRFWCKSQSDLVIGGRVAKEEVTIEPGDVVSGLDMRFRIEESD
jgi:hypothetical protein